MDALKEQWLILLSTPIYMLVIGLELLLSHFHRRNIYTLKDSVANVYLMLLNSALDLGFRVIYLAILNYFYQRSLDHDTAGYFILDGFDLDVRIFYITGCTVSTIMCGCSGPCM
jgi:hypothetical protein